MKKLLLIPNNLKQINKTKKLVDGYIVPIKNLSANYFSCFDIEDIPIIINKTKKEIFISLNKNIHNNDLEFLKNVLLKIDKLNVKGILYYDVAILNLKQELNLKTDLVWAQEHSVVNSKTINFFYGENVNYSYLSSELNIKEIENIIRDSKATLLMNVFGYFPIFTSVRPLVDNYLKTFNVEDNSKVNYILKEGKKYPIIKGETTTIFSNEIFCGLEEYLKLDVDYFVINSFNIGSKDVKKVLKIFRETSNNNLSKKQEQLNKLFDNLGKAFLYKNVIYKVGK